MRLVVLYGPPGVGKLTVAGALSELTRFRVFHNHLTVDLVTAVFPPGSEAWNRLAARIRRTVFAAAADEGIDLILTRAPRAADRAEVARVRAMTRPVRAAGGEVVFVQLACDREELLVRVRGDDRRARGKLTDPARLTEMYELDATLPFEPHLRLDTTRLPPAEAAARIAEQFGLPVLAEDGPPVR
jgi:chloramphenicol 3-O-phosphotransferase